MKNTSRIPAFQDKIIEDNTMKTHSPFFCRLILTALLLAPLTGLHAAEPKTGDSKRLDLGDGVTLEALYLPPGEFMMGSSPEEKKWATGIEGGAQPGTNRESFEGEEPRLTRVKHGCWMGRTEVSVGQFKRFALESKYVTDAEKPEGKTQCFDMEWDGYRRKGTLVQPWKPMPGKSWRDPNWGFPNRDVFPVVCVSYNDMNAFCKWLTERERKAGRLLDGLEYRLPTEAEWEYGCRGGSKESLNTNTFVPRGSTALLDAIGKTIDDIGTRLSQTPESDRPGKVILAILTDGEENASTVYTPEKVAGMIRNQQEQYKWDVIFLAANQDAILAAKKLAIPSENAINFSPSGAGVKMAFSSLNADINHRRESHRSSKPKEVK